MVLYCSLFISLFFEVFLLITYLEVRGEIKRENALLALGPKHFPSVTVIVPCFNEQATVTKTVWSILKLDYPKDKLALILVDDGSTDDTREELEKFANHPQIKILSKENGGKHTAVNLALKHVETDLVGCLDADSFVMPETLRNMVPYFDDTTIMAVTPSIKVHTPTNLLQSMQTNEYRWGVFLRRMLSSMGALYVTPGPFSIFRSTVFKELGDYRHAHLTEDMEMALRMQKHHYKIVNSHSAHVYTVTPHKIGGLIKQRTRWTYGFLNNVFDYRELFFNRKYGNIGLFILPIATFSIFFTPFMVSNMLVKTGSGLLDKLNRIQTVGINWDFSFPSFDWYFLNTGVVPMLTLGVLAMTFVIIYLSMKLADGKAQVDRGLVSYLVFYSFIVPIWLTKAVFNTIFRRQVTWR